MSPIIYTTGNPDIPLDIRELRGETTESIRAMAVNKTHLASTVLVLRDVNRAKLSLKELNMPEPLAQALIDAVISGETGFGVAFETVYSEKNRIGGPRRYENFHLMRKEN